MNGKKGDADVVEDLNISRSAIQIFHLHSCSAQQFVQIGRIIMINITK